jgi:ribose transport system permease protein/L-arabinose transport system permease protein
MTDQKTIQPKAADTSRERQSALTWRRVLRVAGPQNIGLIAGLVLMIVFFGTQNPNFFLLANVVNIGLAVSILGIVAVAQTVVIITGGLDISVGSIAGLCSVVTAIGLSSRAADDPLGIVVGIALGLLVGLLAGVFNGLLITLTGISPVIITLGTYTSFVGVAYLLSSGVGVPVLNQAFNSIGSGTLFGIPYPVLILALVAIGYIIFLRYTDLGRNTYAIGGNPTAALLAGIRISRYRIAIYGLTGVISAIAGIVLAARVSSGQPASGSADLALSSITAVLLGGTALTGGKGSVLGTVLGVIVLGTLNNGLLLLGVSSYWQSVAQGAVLIVVVILQVKPWSAASRAARR